MIKLADIHGDETYINPHNIAGFKVVNEYSFCRGSRIIYRIGLHTIVILNNNNKAVFKGDISDKFSKSDAKLPHPNAGRLF